MPTPRPSEARNAASPGWPARTHWSAVLAAGDPASPRAAAALEELCRAYWYPIYVYIRRCGYNAVEAEDLTQSFFLHLLTANTLALATPYRARFRVFLRTCVGHFIITCWRKEHALKRGRGVTFLSWERDALEERYRQDAIDPLPPERSFDRSWADTLLNRVLSQLEAELAAKGKATLFEPLKDRLTGDLDAVPYAALARELGMTEAALKTSVSRLRQRYGELLVREVARTVTSREEAEQELKHLLAVVST